MMNRLNKGTYAVRRPVNGYLCAVLAAGFWAASGTLSKSLFNAGITPFQLVQLRTTIAAAFLLAWFLIGKRRMFAVRPADLIVLLLLGVVLAFSQVTYFYAISKIQVAGAILLQYLAPVLIAIYAVLFGHKRLALPTVLAVAAAVAGCYLVSGVYNQSIPGLSRAGIIAGLGSAVFFAIYTVVSGSVMRRYQPQTVVFYALFFAAVFWNIAHPPFSAFAGGYGPESWLKILSIGLFGTILPFIFYNEGIKRIGATHTSVAASMEPVFAGIMAYAFLSETLEALQILGAGLVIAAVIVLQIRRSTPAEE